MNKKVKSVLICVLVIAILAIIVLLLKINSKLPENPSDYAGNTAGNLYNRGLFVEDDDYIYFANLADGYRLYRMDKSLENVTRVHKDSVEYLNLDASSEYLYYSRTNYRHNTQGTTAFDLLSSGIYRLNVKTSAISRFFTEPCGTVLLAGNSLFYQEHGLDGSYDLYSVPTNKDGAESALITTDYITPVSYSGNLLYYSGIGDDHYLYAYSPDTGSTNISAEIDCYLPIVTSEGVYFLSQAHDYALYFLPNNSDEASLLVEERICTYNLSADGTKLFYQIDNGRSNRLCRYDIASSTETTILDGDYKYLNTVSNYVFFTDFAETVCYCYDIASDTVFSFMPVAEE
ncbi:MAG: DUF5050 domain-containing protein [Lachnospiraceae bacterium]|nr:DUF5050 domain-containing protein [Lachnospiraceae bacterium]